MVLPKIDPTTTKAWQKLITHFNTVKDIKMTALFAENPNRGDEFKIIWDDFYVDFSKNRITEKTLKYLITLAEEVELKTAIKNYFSGAIINETEKRAVLHTALRAPNSTAVFVDGVNIIPEIIAVKQTIKTFSNKIISGDHKGFTGKPITDIVNIGIGGSDLGPATVVKALTFYKNHLKTHFISNVEGDHVHEILKHLNPETTLFVIVSKTFTTQETLSNANTIKQWFLESATVNAVSKHFVAVSTNIEKATTFGITKDNIFPMWDWVGGRFSLWSAVGLSISLAIGYNHFEALLSGAQKMDNHFKEAPLDKNIPVILALIGIWYNNFFKSETEAIIPYSNYLSHFTNYLQQAIMESNGKTTDRNGHLVNYQTGTIIWGAPGTNAQHAFFQLLHQGTKLIPSDFIGFAQPLHGNTDHQDKLISNFIAQTEALMNGKTAKEIISELSTKDTLDSSFKKLLPYKVFEGNKPSNTIFIKKLTPESLGKLIALYEHKIFVQGVIWNIFSYDQFGVELGKQLANTILQEIKAGQKTPHDSSTEGLVTFYRKNSTSK